MFELAIHLAWVPAVLTAICLYMLCRPYHQIGMYDFGAIFRILWLIPIGFIWAVYFLIEWRLSR